MSYRRALRCAPLLLLALSCACSAVPRVGTAPSTGGVLSREAPHLILITVDNSFGAPRPEAGSTAHGYDRSGPYAIGDRARAAARALSQSYGLTAVRAWPIASLKVYCLVLAVPPGVDRQALLARLAADRRVRLAEPLQRFDTLAGAHAAYNDPYLSLQWGFAAIDAGAAQRWTRGQGVNIAIIDTGADLAHPDMAGRVAAARNFVDDDSAAFSTDRHGTQVAGIIGAVANNGVGIAGISPAARLHIYKACEPLLAHQMAAQCNSFSLALALSAAIEERVQIVNLSLSGPADPLLSELVTRGERAGIVFVGAVPGNGELSGFPLGVPGVIAADDSGHASRSSAVLPAPGREVLSLMPGGHYDFATGSSFAAAHVSGAIALLRSEAPAATSQMLQAALAGTRIQSAQGETIDVCAALAALQPRDPCQPASRTSAKDAARSGSPENH